VEFSAAVAHDLAVLTQASGVDLVAALQQLGTDLERAVPSYVAMTITIVSSGHPVSFTATRDGVAAPEVRASLQIPVQLLVSSEPDSTLTFFAAGTDAFRDLAAELRRSAGTLGAAIAVDAHLQPPLENRSSGLADVSTIHQAIGVLIAAGYDPADAQAELGSIARRSGIEPVRAARDILATTSRETQPDRDEPRPTDPSETD
jgi:hypothetical protein